MASHLQIPPKQSSAEKGPSQGDIAGDKRRQPLKDLQPHCDQSRKRRLTKAFSEESQSRKRLQNDFGGDGTLIALTPGEDDEMEIEIKLRDMLKGVSQMKLRYVEEGKTKGYVEKKITFGCRPSWTLCGNPVRWRTLRARRQLT